MESLALLFANMLIFNMMRMRVANPAIPRNYSIHMLPLAGGLGAAMSAPNHCFAGSGPLETRLASGLFGVVA